MSMFLFAAVLEGAALTQAMDVVAAPSSISGRYERSDGPVICLSREIHSNGRYILHRLSQPFDSTYMDGPCTRLVKDGGSCRCNLTRRFCGLALTFEPALAAAVARGFIGRVGSDRKCNVGGAPHTSNLSSFSTGLPRLCTLALCRMLLVSKRILR